MDTDMRAVIDSSFPLTPRHIQFFVYQLLCGLNYLHSAQVAHRDIKPSNLLLNEDNLLRLTDFGLCRALHRTEAKDLTKYVVTRWYRAPEVLCSNTGYDTKVDMWSVGCILAELFRRKALFTGKDTLKQLQYIFALLGTPSEEDLSWINDPKASRWIRAQTHVDPLPMHSVLPVDVDLLVCSRTIVHVVIDARVLPVDVYPLAPPSLVLAGVLPVDVDLPFPDVVAAACRVWQMDVDPSALVTNSCVCVLVQGSCMDVDLSFPDVVAAACRLWPGCGRWTSTCRLSSYHSLMSWLLRAGLPGVACGRGPVGRGSLKQVADLLALLVVAVACRVLPVDVDPLAVDLLSKVLPVDVDPLAVDLLSKLLTFSPHKRLSAADALKHPYLKQVRDWSLGEDAHCEDVTAGPWVCEVDQMKDVKIPDIRRMLWSEVQHFHPELQAPWGEDWDPAPAAAEEETANATTAHSHDSDKRAVEQETAAESESKQQDRDKAATAGRSIAERIARIESKERARDAGKAAAMFQSPSIPRQEEKANFAVTDESTAASNGAKEHQMRSNLLLTSSHLAHLQQPGPRGSDPSSFMSTAKRERLSQSSSQRWFPWRKSTKGNAAEQAAGAEAMAVDNSADAAVPMDTAMTPDQPVHSVAKSQATQPSILDGVGAPRGSDNSYFSNVNQPRLGRGGKPVQRLMPPLPPTDNSGGSSTGSVGPLHPRGSDSSATGGGPALSSATSVTETPRDSDPYTASSGRTTRLNSLMSSLNSSVAATPTGANPVNAVGSVQQSGKWVSGATPSKPPSKLAKAVGQRDSGGKAAGAR
eukprot:g81527.t1